MSCETFARDDLYVVVWHTPTPADVKLVLEEMTALRQRAGRALAYVGIIPAGSKMPDEEGRVAVAEALETLGKLTDERHVVYEGKGFAAAATRSVFSFIMLRTTSSVRAEVSPTIDAMMKKMKSDSRRANMKEIQAQIPTAPSPAA